MSLDSLNWQLKRLGNGVWAMALLGNIKSGTLPNLLRALSLRRATATLVCEQTPQIRATVHMIDGKLRRVTLGDLYGEPALSQLFRWKEGYYYLIKGRIEENVGPISAPTGANDPRKHILVVDDDAQATALIERYLEREGYRVSIAFEGKHALELIANVKPDLVLLDVMMPGMNGLEVARRLREKPETENLPIIIISAVVREMPEAYRQWDWPFVSKPFKAQTLLQTVKDELLRQPLPPPEFTVSRLDFDPSISPEIIDLLIAELPLPPPDTVFVKSEALEIRLALGSFSEETVRLFDLFDGTRTLGEIVNEYSLVASKINFLAVHMATFGLLEKLDGPVCPQPTGKTTTLLLSQLDAIDQEQKPPITGSLVSTDAEHPEPEEVPTLLLTPTEIGPLSARLKDRYGPSTMCAKLAVFGLVGRVQSVFTSTLRLLARKFQSELTEPVKYHLPPLPGTEVARLPLATDCGLFVYQLSVDSEYPKLVRQVGNDMWGILLLTDVQNRFEVNYTRYLIQAVAEPYQLPYLVALFDPRKKGINIAPIAREMEISTDYIATLDVSSPNSFLDVLRKLIQQPFPQPEKKNDLNEELRMKNEE